MLSMMKIPPVHKSDWPLISKPMRTYLKGFLPLLCIFLITGCGDESNNKQKYLEAYRLFIHEVTMGGQNYSEQDWREATSRNNLYANTYFQNLRHKLSEQEASEVRMLNKRFMKFQTRGRATLYLLDFQHFIYEIEKDGEILTTEQWKLADKEFDEYYNRGFKKHYKQLSKSELKEVISLGVKYSQLRFKYGSDKLLEQVSKDLDMTMDIVKDFIKDLF